MPQYLILPGMHLKTQSAVSLIDLVIAWYWLFLDLNPLSIFLCQLSKRREQLILFLSDGVHALLSESLVFDASTFR